MSANTVAIYSAAIKAQKKSFDLDNRAADKNAGDNYLSASLEQMSQTEHELPADLLDMMVKSRGSNIKSSVVTLYQPWKERGATLMGKVLKAMDKVDSPLVIRAVGEGFALIGQMNNGKVLDDDNGNIRNEGTAFASYVSGDCFWAPPSTLATTSGKASYAWETEVVDAGKISEVREAFKAISGADRVDLWRR